MQKILTALLITLLYVSISAMGQNWDPGKLPRNMMQSLTPLSGDYRLVVYSSDDDGETWQAGEPQTVSLSFKQNGLMLEELPLTPQTKGFHMASYLTYDQYRQVFRKAAIDDVWGIMDIYKGVIENDVLVMTNLDAGTFFPIGDNQWRGFRLRIPLIAGERTMWIDKTDNNGESFEPAFKAVYSPITD